MLIIVSSKVKKEESLEKIKEEKKSIKQDQYRIDFNCKLYLPKDLCFEDAAETANKIFESLFPDYLNVKFGINNIKEYDKIRRKWVDVE